MPPSAQRSQGAVLAVVLLASCLAGCGSSGSGGTPVAGSTRVVVALPLKVDAAGLAEAALAASDPTSKSFDHYLTTAEVASRYGASPSIVSADEQELRRLGLPLVTDATHGALWGVVTAAQAQKLFGTTLVESGGVVYPAGTPKVPAGLTDVTGVVGLDATAASSTSASPASATPPCPSDIPSRESVARLFGFSNLIANGNEGAGTTIDILAIHNVEPAVYTTFSACAGTSISPHIVENDVPHAASLSGGPEVALDTLVVSLLAPKAQLSVTGFDGSTAIAFPLLELLDQRGPTPDVVDDTVYYCEPDIPSGDLSLSEWLLSALAATGTTVVGASGDYGSSACHPGSNDAAVAYPASSRFVSAVGGAQYAGAAEDPTDLAAWNSPGQFGGGGGTSTRIAAPPWQPSGKRRLPDVAAYAQPGGVGSIPVCPTQTSCQWQTLGGTSMAATVLSAVAVLVASDGKTEHRWGVIVARLWRGAAADTAWTDISKGETTTFTSSCCQAAQGYDGASGWGLLEPDEVLSLQARRG